MQTLLIVAVGVLSFANGATDNFKGVATLWGAGLTTYRRAIGWATGLTFLGSLTAIWLGSALAAKFSGAQLVDSAVVSHLPFLTAVALGSGATVLLAARLGLPISTTHSIAGALVGAGVTAVGFSHVKVAALGRGVFLPLLFSPLVALVLTVGIQFLLTRLGWQTGKRDCICVDEPRTPRDRHKQHFVFSRCDRSFILAMVACGEECDTGAEILRLSIADALYWFSGAAISFARGLNDTPKIVAVLLVAAATSVKPDYLFVALAIAVGGALGAFRVAQTMSKNITPMDTREAITANSGGSGARDVLATSPFALPVSTTHVMSGGIFGIGLLLRHEADWSKVRDIVLSWVATLPLSAVLASVTHKLLMMWWS